MNPDVLDVFDQVNTKLKAESGKSSPATTKRSGGGALDVFDNLNASLKKKRSSAPASTSEENTAPSGSVSNGDQPTPSFTPENVLNPYQADTRVNIGGEDVDLRDETPSPASNIARDENAKGLKERINAKKPTREDLDFISSRSSMNPQEVSLAVHEPEKFSKFKEIQNKISESEINVSDMDYLAKNMPEYAKGLIKKIAPDLSGNDLSGETLQKATDRINEFAQEENNKLKNQQSKLIDARAKKLLSSVIVDNQPVNTSKLIDESYADKVLDHFNSEKQNELSLLERKYPLVRVKVNSPNDRFPVYQQQRRNDQAYQQEHQNILDKYDQANSILATSRANDYAKKHPTADPFEIGMEYLKYADRGKYTQRKNLLGGSAIDNDIAQQGITALYGSDNKDIWKVLNMDEKGLDDRYPDKKRTEIYHRLGAELYKGENWFINRQPSISDLDKAASKLKDKDRDFYYKHVRPIEAKNIGTEVPMSGLVNKAGEGFATTAIETGKFLGDITGLRSTEDQNQESLDAPYHTRYQDVGTHFESKAELDALTKKEKKEGLTKEEKQRKADLQQFTDVRSTGQEIVDGSGNLAGQVLFQAVATKGLAGVVGKGVKAAGFLKSEAALSGLGTEASIAHDATNIGISKNLITAVAADAVAFGSSYDASMRDALQIFPDEKDTGKRKLYANLVAGFNAASERIFKDEKVLDAFKSNVAPNVVKLVGKISSEGLSKAAIKTSFKDIARAGLEFAGHSTVENLKETTEEVATSIATSMTKFMLAPAKFNEKDAYDDAISTATTMFLNGGLIAGMAGLHEFRANYAAIPMMTQLGADERFTNNVKNEISRQALSKVITQEEANEKMRMVNDAIQINKNEMPELNGKNLPEKTRGKYFSMLLNERNLTHQLAETKDDVTKQALQQQIDESKAIREGIFKVETAVNEKYEPEIDVKDDVTGETETKAGASTEDPLLQRLKDNGNVNSLLTGDDTQMVRDQSLNAPHSLSNQLKDEELTTDIIATHSPEEINDAISSFEKRLKDENLSDQELKDVDAHIDLLDKGLQKRKAMGTTEEADIQAPDEAVSTTATAIKEFDKGNRNPDGTPGEAMASIRKLVPKEFYNPKKHESQIVSEAYHAAIANGSNPELVEAVDGIIGRESEQPKEQASEITEREKAEFGTGFKHMDFSRAIVPTEKIRITEQPSEAGAFKEIKDDIKKNGIKEPIMVQFDEESGNYYVKNGNHRAAAAKELGIKEMNVIIAEPKPETVLASQPKEEAQSDPAEEKKKQAAAILAKRKGITPKAEEGTTGNVQEAAPKEESSIEQLEKAYNEKSVEDLVDLKKKLYPNPDIGSPMTKEEKLLDKVIAQKFSDKNEEIRQKRNKAAAEKPTKEEIQPNVIAGKEGFRKLSDEEKSKLPPHQNGKSIAGEDHRLSELDLSENDKVIDSYNGKIYTVKPLGTTNKNASFPNFELTDSEGRIRKESERPIYQKVNSQPKEEVKPSTPPKQPKEKKQAASPDKKETAAKKTEKRKAQRKIRDAKGQADIDAAWDDFMKGDGLMTSGGLDPKRIEAGTKLIGLYIKQGVHKFSDIIEDAYAKFGPKLKDIFNELKAVYSAYYNTQATDEEAEKMDSNVRSFSYEKLVADKFNEQTRGDDGIQDEEQGEVSAKPEQYELVEKNEPHRLFTDTVKEKILKGEKMNIVSLRKMASELGLNVKDTHLQELVELAVVELSKDVVSSNKLDAEKFEDIKTIYENQPSLNMRSGDRMENQQYSTPIPHSFVAGMYVGAIQPKSVLEPSAGNGAMTIYFDPAIVHANEIDKVRLDNLEQQNFKSLTNQDALQPFPIGNQDGIVMNPPFGKAPEIVAGEYHISGMAETMAINALRSLSPNGRAAIIIGGHNSFDSKGRFKGQRNFFNYLYSHYNVADVINLDGQLYRKNGTTFPIRLILIDGVRPVVEGLAPLQTVEGNKVVTSFDELYNRVNNIKDQHAQNILSPGLDGKQQPGNDLHGEGTAGNRSENEGTATTVSTGKVRPANTGNRKTSRKSGASVGGSDGSGSPNVNANPNGNGISDNGIGSVPNVEGQVSGEQPEERPAIVPGGDGTVQGSDTVQPVRNDVPIDISKQKVAYRPMSKGNAVGSVIPTQMATEAEKVLSQLEQQHGAIDDFVADKLDYPNKAALYKALSAEQIDAVAIAIDQIDKGQGMIIGDQTGVGKGRIAAAVVRYGVGIGLKPIFLTERANLFSDLYRDLVDIGSSNLVPLIMNSKDPNNDPTITDEKGNVVHKLLSKNALKGIIDSQRVPDGFHLVMGTYSQLNSKGPTAKKAFLYNMAAGNIIVMDESHNASGESNTSEYFKEVLAVAKGVTFLSATFAKRPNNMPVYAMKTAMQEANMTEGELVNAIKQGGVALQEVISSQLVESGQMLRRERDMTGVERSFETLEEVAGPHREIADKVTSIIRDVINFQADYVDPVLDAIDGEMAGEQGQAKTRQGTSQAGINNTPFASKVFQVIDQFLFALKVNDVADAAVKELKDGRKPVIAFKSTMESFLNKLDVKPGDKLEKSDFSLTLGAALTGTMRYTVSDYKGDKTPASLSVLDLSPEGQAKYHEIMKNITSTSTGISISPIDVMVKRIQDAGFKVKEITGRAKMLEFHDDGSSTVVARKEKDVKAITREFNDGSLDVVLLNGAGATGISLHASGKFKDQRPRVMLNVQLQLDINKVVQTEGRIDRTGQVARGSYRNFSTAIPAEQRLLMMSQKKQKSLSANTTSDQKSKSAGDMVDFLNKYGDEIVTEYLKEEPELNHKLLDPLKMEGKTEDELDKMNGPEGAAHKVTGRVAILSSTDQEAFYKEVMQRYNDYMEYLESNDSNDLELKELPLNAETKGSTVVIEGKGGSSPFGKDSVLETVEVDVLKKPMEKADIDAEVNNYLKGETPEEHSDKLAGKLNGFYEKFMVKKIKDINADYDKRKADVLERVRKKAIKDGSQDVEADVKEAERLHDIGRESFITRFTNKYEQMQQALARNLKYFKAGNIYEVPTSIRIETTVGTSKGIFLGFGIKEHSRNPYAASAIKMRFAVNDGRRVVVVPLSKQDFVNAVISNSGFTPAAEKQRALENWDTLKSSRTRNTRHIITGNLLQAYGTNTGQLISYTTSDGQLKKGLLLPEDYKSDQQKLRLSIIKAGDYLKSVFSKVTTVDKEVTLSNEGKYFSIAVPLSASSGRKYFTDQELKDLVSSNGFNQEGGRMVAYFSAGKLDQVTKYLQDRHGSSFEVEMGRQGLNSGADANGDQFKPEQRTAQETKDIFDDLSDKIRSLKFQSKDNMFSLVPPFNLIPAAWNLAIEVAARSIKVAGSINKAARMAMAALKEAFPDQVINDETQFVDELKRALGVKFQGEDELSEEGKNMAKTALQNISAGGFVAVELNKIKNYIEELKGLLDDPEDKRMMDEEYGLIQDYIKSGLRTQGLPSTGTGGNGGGTGTGSNATGSNGDDPVVSALKRWEVSFRDKQIRQDVADTNEKMLGQQMDSADYMRYAMDLETSKNEMRQIVEQAKELYGDDYIQKLMQIADNTPDISATAKQSLAVRLKEEAATKSRMVFDMVAMWDKKYATDASAGLNVRRTDLEDFEDTQTVSDVMGPDVTDDLTGTRNDVTEATLSPTSDEMLAKDEQIEDLQNQLAELREQLSATPTPTTSQVKTRDLSQYRERAKAIENRLSDKKSLIDKIKAVIKSC